MLRWISRYAHWLHLRWPAGIPERLPRVGTDGRTNIPRLRIVGDLTGIPLLKMALQSAADCVADLADGLDGQGDEIDIVIIGGGVAGMAAAIEAKKRGLRYVVLEANQAFSTLVNFPKGKPIFAYPTDMQPSSELQVHAEVKEDLIAELRQQVEDQGIVVTEGYTTHVQRDGQGFLIPVKDGEAIRAKACIIAIGRSGNFRRMDIPGEDREQVSNRMIDPADYADQRVCIVGGGDSACEAAIAIAEAQRQRQTDGASLILAYRRKELSRPKPDNARRVHELAEAGHVDLRLATEPTAIGEQDISLRQKDDGEETVPCDAVLALIGREPPLDFLRRSGVAIHGEHSLWRYGLYAAFLLFGAMLYAWKGGIGPLGYETIKDSAWYPAQWFSALATLWPALSDWWQQPGSLPAVIIKSASSPSFWVTCAYSAAVVGFGIDRMRRRRTPYVRWQTLTLMAIQVLPLFLLPEILLPWLGANGWLPTAVIDNLFPDESYWRAYGFILAWPLMVWNVFTQDPLWWWLGISLLQTFVLIPLLVWRWGKGAYCGWICSCGALAETMGDRHREKMPHGPFWNKLNFVGQVLLGIALLMLALFIITWISPGLSRYHEARLDAFTVTSHGDDWGVRAASWTAHHGAIAVANAGDQQHQVTLVIDDHGIAVKGDWHPQQLRLSPGAEGLLKFDVPTWQSVAPDLDEVCDWRLVDERARVIARGTIGITAGENDWLSGWLLGGFWKHAVDYLIAGALGVGLYFWLSGRVWCRFACPLAALMHIYARFSRFRILVEQKKCISCNACTSVCHQGIDVMNFANRGQHMADPQCVRCSACVQTCPTGVLQFGRVDANERPLATDRLAASPVLMREAAADRQTGSEHQHKAP